VWDVEAGTEKFVLPGHSRVVYSVAYSADGTQLGAAAADTAVRTWDPAGQLQVECKPVMTWAHKLAFSPDLSLVAAGYGFREPDQHRPTGVIKVWRIADGEEIHTFHGHRNWVYSVAFSPDGTKVVSGGWDGTLKLWDLDSGKELATMVGHQDIVQALAFAPDGQTLASAGHDQRIYLWNLSRVV
jgi:WD40 repeat protein